MHLPPTFRTYRPPRFTSVPDYPLATEGPDAAGKYQDEDLPQASRPKRDSLCRRCAVHSAPEEIARRSTEGAGFVLCTRQICAAEHEEAMTTWDKVQVAVGTKSPPKKTPLQKVKWAVRKKPGILWEKLKEATGAKPHTDWDEVRERSQKALSTGLEVASVGAKTALIFGREDPELIAWERRAEEQELERRDAEQELEQGAANPELAVRGWRKKKKPQTAWDKVKAAVGVKPPPKETAWQKVKGKVTRHPPQTPWQKVRSAVGVKPEKTPFQRARTAAWTTFNNVVDMVSSGEDVYKASKSRRNVHVAELEELERRDVDLEEEERRDSDLEELERRDIDWDFAPLLVRDAELDELD